MQSDMSAGVIRSIAISARSVESVTRLNRGGGNRAVFGRL